MEIPECLNEMARDAALKWPDDIGAAAREAERVMRERTDFDTVAVPVLVSLAVQELVYRARVGTNDIIKGRFYGGPAKVSRADSEEVQAAYADIYAYCVGGKTLGELDGAELPDLREQEVGRANGHMANADLLAWLVPRVKVGQKVREAVKRKQLETAFKRFQRRHGGDEPAAAAGG